ncbi:hypothetical protein D3C83_281090 [compost metagenome]
MHTEDDDFCLCDIDIKASETTGDADLPVTVGGVLASVTLVGEDVDGCDVDFARGKGTGDGDLPEARGGVA